MHADIPYNSDFALPCHCNEKKTLSPSNDGNNIYIVPPPMPMDYPPPPFPPYPPYPPFPPPPPPFPPKPEPLPQQSVEAQICKLSRKAAAIKAMIEGFKDKNKDCIWKIGGTSYNFGTYQKVYEENGETVKEDTVYGPTILSILNQELAAIQAKIKELAEEIDDEEVETIGGVEHTVQG